MAHTFNAAALLSLFAAADQMRRFLSGEYDRR